MNEGESCRLCYSHPPSLVCPPLSSSFLGNLQCQVLAVSHTGRHSQNRLSGIPTVQCAVQAAGTSEVVASSADALTSVCVLAEPALPGDHTVAEGLASCAAELFMCVFSPLAECSFHLQSCPGRGFLVDGVLCRVCLHGFISAEVRRVRLRHPTGPKMLSLVWSVPSEDAGKLNLLGDTFTRCFRILFAWFDSEYMYMRQSWRYSDCFPNFLREGGPRILRSVFRPRSTFCGFVPEITYG